MEYAIIQIFMLFLLVMITIIIHLIDIAYCLLGILALTDPMCCSLQGLPLLLGRATFHQFTAVKRAQ